MWDIHSRNYLSVDVLTFWDWAEYSRSTCFFNNRWLFLGCFCSWWLGNWGNIVFQGFSFSFSHDIEWVVAGHWIFFQFRMVLIYFFLKKYYLYHPWIDFLHGVLKLQDTKQLKDILAEEISKIQVAANILVKGYIPEDGYTSPQMLFEF